MATLAKTDRSTTITLATASAGPFDLGFRIFDDEDLAVYIDGVKNESWTLTATFSNGYTDSATVTLAAPALVGTIITIEGDLDAGRDENYLPADPRLTANLNIELGRIWAAIRDARRDNGRSVRLLSDANVLTVDAVKDRMLKFDSVGQPVPTNAFAADFENAASFFNSYLAADPGPLSFDIDLGFVSTASTGDFDMGTIA